MIEDAIGNAQKIMDGNDGDNDNKGAANEIDKAKREFEEITQTVCKNHLKWMSSLSGKSNVGLRKFFITSIIGFSILRYIFQGLLWTSAFLRSIYFYNSLLMKRVVNNKTPREITFCFGLFTIKCRNPNSQRAHLCETTHINFTWTPAFNEPSRCQLLID